jgi:hypothetical protein
MEHNVYGLAKWWNLTHKSREPKSELKTKFNITSVFSAEKLNGNSAKQLL